MADAYEKMKKAKRWHHDIKKIDGEWVEVVVKEYQEAEGEEKQALLAKILENYSIFKAGWAKEFAKFLGNDEEDGEQMHDSILWRSATNFSVDKGRKALGRSFNAYLVSALLNALKNLRNGTRSYKNHPRVKCPICGEQVYQIDERHLRHRVGITRYKKEFPHYPLSSPDGLVPSPINGEMVEELTEPYVNRLIGRYSPRDFRKEFPGLVPPAHPPCPVTGMRIDKLTSQYPSCIKAGYSEEEFIQDFPNFEGIIECPFSGERTLEMSRERLDRVLGQEGRERVPMGDFVKQHPRLTLRARQIPVLNPYASQRVPELTPAMLAKAGTSVVEHLENHAGIWLNKYYFDLVACPFTGRKTHKITSADLEKLGKTTHQFYNATCKYPLRRWQVKCAICGRWVDNVWAHLEEKEHNYFPPMSLEEFERSYGHNSTKRHVSTNAWVENDSGEDIHMADLFSYEEEDTSPMEVEDSLMKVAEDDMDRRIAGSVKGAQTLEDVFVGSSCKKTINLPFKFEGGQTKGLKGVIRDMMGLSDFDLAFSPNHGESRVIVMMPGRETIRRRLLRMISASDLVEEQASTTHE